MTFKFYGHACFSVEMGGKSLLFDPFISPNEKAKSIDVDAIAADYILISHGHEDHVADVERIAKRTGATIIGGYEVATYFQNKGFDAHPMNHGGKWKFDFGTVKYVNAIHSNSLPDGSYAGHPGGFVLWNDDASFYYSGDTALTMDMQLIPLLCPKLDFAVLCIGDNFTMGYEEALLASDYVEAYKIVGVHFDTFGFIEINHDLAKATFAATGKALLLPEIGETINL